MKKKIQECPKNEHSVRKQLKNPMKKIEFFLDFPQI